MCLKPFSRPTGLPSKIEVSYFFGLMPGRPGAGLTLERSYLSVHGPVRYDLAASIPVQRAPGECLTCERCDDRVGFVSRMLLEGLCGPEQR